MIRNAVLGGALGAVLLTGLWLWNAQGQAVWLLQSLPFCG